MKELSREYVEGRYRELGNARGTYAKIVDEVKERFDEVVGYDAVRKICKKVDALRETIKEVNDSVKDSKPYEVVDGKYVMKAKDMLWKFDVDEVDAMFYDFSVHGANLSGEQMLQKYELKPEAWQLIKNRLRLYKHSNVISPYTAEHSTEEDLDARIEEATTRHIDSIKTKMVMTHERMFKEEAKKAFSRLANIDTFLEHVRTHLEGYSPKDVKFENNERMEGKSATFVISDIHIGKTNTSLIIERLSSVLEAAKKHEAQHIEVVMLGDLVETLAQDGMHPGQIAYGTDHAYGKYGFDLLMDTVNVFEKFLIEIRKSGKSVNVHGITGNHGRMTANKEDDKKRTGELVAYELIKRGVERAGVNVTYYRNVINAVTIDGIHYILMHGDGKVGKDAAEKILLTHGKPGMYNVIMGGDWHTLKTYEGPSFVYLRVPALAGRGEYDTDMNLHSEPGYVIIERNEWDTADIAIKRLKNG